MSKAQSLARHALMVGVALFVLVLLGTLAACASSPTIQTVKVAVPTECKETVPERPVMPTEQFTSKPGLDQFVQASQAEIPRREAYEKKLRTALEACTAAIDP
jgi:hypothetical protein